jgi:hypothetical protein
LQDRAAGEITIHSECRPEAHATFEITRLPLLRPHPQWALATYVLRVRECVDTYVRLSTGISDAVPVSATVEVLSSTMPDPPACDITSSLPACSVSCDLAVRCCYVGASGTTSGGFSVRSSFDVWGLTASDVAFFEITP